VVSDVAETQPLSAQLPSVMIVGPFKFALLQVDVGAGVGTAVVEGFL
jgi:hypothetical protein